MPNSATPEPHVGIFWRVPDRSATVLVADSVPLNAAEPYGDCLTYSDGHHDVWERWRRLGAHELSVRGLPVSIVAYEYEALPRGRVVFQCVAKTFVIYADRKLLGSKEVDRIVERFGLEKKKWRIQPDAHYRT